MKLMAIATLIISVTIPLSLMAAAKDSGKVRFSDPITVGGKVLPAGRYQVKWTGEAGPVQVSFLKGKDVVATAPAELVDQKTPYSNAVETKREPDKSSLLEAIDWTKMSLHFQTNQSSNNSGTGSSGS